MAEGESERGELRVAGTASSAPEAELMCQRLADVGIHAIWQRAIGGPSWGESGGQYVYVRADQLDRAREILEAGEGISEADLIEAEEEDAARRRSPKPPE
ncbi:MAG: hypothetical protein FWD42_10685 [Solirubrobacterales bacterium]|nr:hypothetical protein [Solirubrobacterales bacterium]